MVASASAGAGAGGLAGERPVHGGRQPARRGAAASASTSPPREPGLRWRLPHPSRPTRSIDLTGARTVEGGLSRFRAQQGAARESLMPHRRREHHQYPVRRSVRPQQPGELHCNITAPTSRGAGRGVPRCAKSSAKSPHGLRALREAARRSRPPRTSSCSASSTATETGIQVSRVDHAERPAARDRSRLRSTTPVKAGRTTSAKEQTGRAYANDLMPPRALYRSRLSRGSQRVPRARGRQCRGRGEPLPARCSQDTTARRRSPASACVSTPCSRSRPAPPGDGRREGQRQPADAAAR